MPRPFRNRLWLFVVLAFLVLIGAWSALITVAQRHKPQPIPLVK